MLLEGHEGEIFSCEFHPEGELLLSTGFDRKICKSPSVLKLSMLHTQLRNHFEIFSYLERIWRM